jgi:hypothetical protein
MGGPNAINSNSHINAGGYNPVQGGAAQAPNLKDFTLTIDDFRQFASGKYNAGAVPGGRAGVHRTWERLERANIDPSEASAIRLAFAFALEDAGVSGAKMAAACKRLGLEADFSFSGNDAKVYTALTREEVRDVIEQCLGGRAGRGRVEQPKVEVPREFKNADLGPLLPEDEKPEVKVEQPKVEPPKVEPPKMEVGGAKKAGGAALPKIASEADFKTFVKGLAVDSEYGKVEEAGTAPDVRGDEKKVFVYKGLVFRSASRSPDHPSLANGFHSKNDLSVKKNKTEAMGLGIEIDDGKGGKKHTCWGITGESGVSTAKSLDGAISYRGGGCTIYVIDTTKLPKGESAWDMERARYGNGYAEKAKDKDGKEIDETKGEVNVSRVPRSAIVGWIKIPQASGYENETDNERRLRFIQNNPQCKIEFNPEYKADEAAA